MSSTDDYDYYVRRSEQEIDQGDRAVSAAVAAIHYELATRYSIRAAHLKAGFAGLRLIDCAQDRIAA